MTTDPLFVLPFRPGGPEQLLRVGDVRRDGDVFRGSMRTGAWNLAPGGGPCTGALGVLVDDVLGSTVLVARPPRSWSVSTEITIDVVGGLPTGGSELLCSGRAVLVAPDGGLARGEVVDDAGRLVAIATQRQRFIPSDVSPSDARTQIPTPVDDGTDTLALIGGTWQRHDSGVDLHLAGWAGLTNPAGNVHGGISLAASEILAGHVIEASGPPLSTTSVHIAYLRPMPIDGTTVYAAHTVHRGRTFGVVRVTAHSAAGRLCTVATVTAQAPPA